MSKSLRKTGGIFLVLCLLVSMLPMDGLSVGTVMAAENGKLQNGNFSEVRTAGQ